MKNFEKYKTAEERIKAFKKHCLLDVKHCDKCNLYNMGKCGGPLSLLYEPFAHWLDLEAEEEKPLPCPFCGSEVKVSEIDNEKKEAEEFYVHCNGCHITTMDFATREELLSMWNNRVEGCQRK